MKTADAENTAKLSSYFRGRSDVAFAFLFGSAARGTQQTGSDIDGLTGRETDLLAVNRAPVRVAYTAITEGVELCVNNRPLFWGYLLTAGRLFEEYGNFVDSFLEIKARAKKELRKMDRESY